MATLSTRLAFRFNPDAPVVHQFNLALDNLFAVLRVLHRLAVQVQVLRVDRLLYSNW